MRRQSVVVVVASGLAVGAGLAVAPMAKASGGGAKLPHYVTNELVSSKSRPSGYLGSDVAISGRTVVVDADGTRVHGRLDAGAVYVYIRSKSGKGRLTQRAVISTPGVGANEEVGPVAVSGDTIVVGAPSATVGATSEAGAAYVFEKPASGWKSTSHPTATLSLGTAVTGAHVGASVAISGRTIVVGAPDQTIGANTNQGAVLVYTKPAHRWRSSSKPAVLTSASGKGDDDLGQSVAIDGGTVVGGAPGREIGGQNDAGMADVFVKPHSGGWATTTDTRELAPKTAVAYLSFGTAVSVSGRHAAVAAEGRADPSNLVRPAVFEFNEPTAGWGTGVGPPLHPSAKLTSSHEGPYDSFGQSIAISSSMIVAGAPDASLDRKYESGAVYLFDKPKKGWRNATQSGQFIAANTERWDSFGYSVALSGTTIVAGAPYSDFTGVHNANDRGTAYVFTEQHQLHRSTIEAAR